MEQFEFAVVIKNADDFDEIHEKITTEYGDDSIPSRPIEIANYRPGSERITHYFLTEEEAEQLRNDSRVQSVERPPHLDPRKGLNHGLDQSANFRKTSSITQSDVNWGLLRCIRSADPWNGGEDITDIYTYTLTGRGVDIVIQDSGITPNHPEWGDENGVSRLQQIDWYTASGLSGTQSVNHYLDYNGHGSHVASIAAGLTQGWAKNSKIYAVKGAGLEGSEGGGISATDAFDVIRLWHLNKPIEPSTGFRRPTIVNMSFGLTISNANLPSNVNYRGNTVFLNTQYTNLTELKNYYGLMGTYSGVYIFPYYSSTFEAEVQDMINAGIHVVVSAGDNNAKIDVPGGIDYDNFYSHTNAGPYYYHRGSAPGTRYAIVVGNMNHQYLDNLETRDYNSETGPGVHLYAPGTHVMGVSSKDNGGTNDTVVNNGLKTVPYSSNINYNMMKTTGTSMSAPQVVGVLACMLELNPGITPAEAKNWLINKSIKNIIYDIGDANLYNNPFSLTGGNNRYLYNPYNSSKDGTMSNGLILRNTIIKLM